MNEFRSDPEQPQARPTHQTGWIQTTKSGSRLFLLADPGPDLLVRLEKIHSLLPLTPGSPSPLPRPYSRRAGSTNGDELTLQPDHSTPPGSRSTSSRPGSSGPVSHPVNHFVPYLSFAGHRKLPGNPETKGRTKDELPLPPYPPITQGFAPRTKGRSFRYLRTPSDLRLRSKNEGFGMGPSGPIPKPLKRRNLIKRIVQGPPAHNHIFIEFSLPGRVT